MMLSQDDEIIIAQCTPKGSGALALIRLTGMGALELGTSLSLLSSGKFLDQMPTHTIHYGWVINGAKERIDQVLFLVMRGPKTFTGQDTVEITCHNNPFLVDAILSEAIKRGARIAQEGEFTKRAVLNSKIDLTQAEAINELINAQTQHALKKSLAQLSGSFSHIIHTLEQKIIKAIALSEASFEFIDEEDMEFSSEIKALITETLDTIATIKKTFNQQQQIREGIRIALIGSVNAGKSSLFNTLLDKERAIVTNIAGTTRDVIEAGLYKAGNYWTLVDTAGLRETNDIIEQAGITRSYQAAHNADIILLIYDGSRDTTKAESAVYQELFERYQNKIILIQSKADMHDAPKIVSFLKQGIKISNKTKENIAHVEKTIEQKIAHLFDSLESPFLLNMRQFNLLATFENKLKTILSLLHGQVAYELVSYHLNDALAHLAELTGKSISEAGMDAVFRDFCVGK